MHAIKRKSSEHARTSPDDQSKHVRRSQLQEGFYARIARWVNLTMARTPCCQKRNRAARARAAHDNRGRDNAPGRPRRSQ